MHSGCKHYIPCLLLRAFSLYRRARKRYKQIADIRRGSFIRLFLPEIKVLIRDSNVTGEAEATAAVRGNVGDDSRAGDIEEADEEAIMLNLMNTVDLDATGRYATITQTIFEYWIRYNLITFQFSLKP